MSVHRNRSIMLNTQTVLRTISVAGGYHNDVKSASVTLDPVALDTVPDTEVPYMVLPELSGGPAWDYSGSKPTSIREAFQMTIYARVDAPGTDMDRKNKAAWDFLADVEKALKTDLQQSGFALYTYMGRPTRPTIYYGLGEQNMVILEIPIEVLIQRTYGLPEA